MTKYKIEGEKVNKHSFLPVRGGTAYAYYGKVKMYSNIKQAEAKVTELNLLGFGVGRTMSHPFLIIPNK